MHTPWWTAQAMSYKGYALWGSQLYSQVLTNDNDMTICHRAHLVSGNYHFNRCCRIFTMATVLKRGKKIPLNFTPGNILTLKPTPLAEPPASFEFALGLHSEKGDIWLSLLFSPRGILLKDRAHRSLGDGWGEPHKVDLKGRSVLEAKVSIHHCLTNSEFGKYQILLNGITIAHFNKRFPGISDTDGLLGRHSWRPPLLECRSLSDRRSPPRGAASPRARKVSRYWTILFYCSWNIRPPLHQFLVLIQWQFLFGHPIFQLEHMHPSVGMMEKRYVLYDIEGWGLFTSSTQIRLYYLGSRNVLHKFAYSVSNDRNNWYYGNLHALNIVLHAT